MSTHHSMHLGKKPSVAHHLKTGTRWITLSDGEGNQVVVFGTLSQLESVFSLEVICAVQDHDAELAAVAAELQHDEGS